VTHVPVRPRRRFLWLAWLALLPVVGGGCAATPPPRVETTAPAAKAEPPPVVEATPPAPTEPVVEAAPPPLRPPTGIEAKTEAAPALLPPGAGAPVVVGLMLPLSGRHRGLGKALRDAAFMALFDLANPRLVLLPKDTGGTAEGAATAATELTQAGAELILGPVFRDAVRGAASVARASGVNIVAFSTDPTVAGDGVYLLGFSPRQQVERVLGYAASRGLWRYAALAPDSAYGLTVVRAMEEVLARQGAEMTNVEYYAPDGSDAAQIVQRLARYQRRSPPPRRRAGKSGASLSELPFDALLLPEGGSVLRAVAPLLPYYDIDSDRVRVLGTGLWDDLSITREPALIGGWFAAPTPEAAADFRRRFEAAYGRRPPRIASLAYDAAALAAVLAAGERGPRFDRESLTAVSGFAGNDGIFRFRQDGVAERGLAVLEVTADGFRILSEAPASFEAPAFQTRPGS
jgi:ABC-type branched-subunit amino acid transport system substrate-binding protein